MRTPLSRAADTLVKQYQLKETDLVADNEAYEMIVNLTGKKQKVKFDKSEGVLNIIRKIRKIINSRAVKEKAEKK